MDIAYIKRGESVEDRRRSHRTTLDDFLVDLLEFIEGKLWLAVADPDAQTRDIAQLGGLGTPIAECASI